MEKGRFGFGTRAYAPTAFAFAVCGEALPCLLILGFVLAAERSQWAAKYVMQALFLCIAGNLVRIVPSALARVFSHTPILGAVFTVLSCTVSVTVFLATLTLAIIGTVNALRRNPHGVPLLNRLTNRLFTDPR